ncbi:MAG: peptidylprolyl isomerase, partial [Cytophagales bacterium]|nr:peptidylprolyl isomerase [Cytophagales bacterium]
MIRFVTIISVFLFISLSSQAQTKPSKKDYLVTIHTELGDIKLILYDETPKHKENFIKLANQKLFDSTTFHRIIKGFMIQGGDPNSKDKDPDNDGMG